MHSWEKRNNINFYFFKSANDNGSSHGDDSASNNRRSARKRRPSVRTGAMKGISSLIFIADYRIY